MLEIGDWVEINCPEKPWFHGQVAEVAHVYFNSPSPSPTWNIYGAVDLWLSMTPGFQITHWNRTNIIELPNDTYHKAVEVLGEDYFA